MKAIGFLVMFLGLTAQIMADNHNVPTSFKVTQQNYTFSTTFEINGENGILGTVTKSPFRIRTNYDLYNAQGECEAIGIRRLLSLGAIYTWATEIDVYDLNNNYVGMVDGQLMTGSGAKFSIYDAVGTRTAIAYLDKTYTSISIVHPENERKILVSLKRNFIHGTVDNWEVTIYNKEAIDMRILKIFAAFAVDSQGEFKEDQ